MRVVPKANQAWTVLQDHQEIQGYKALPVRWESLGRRDDQGNRGRRVFRDDLVTKDLLGNLVLRDHLDFLVYR